MNKYQEALDELFDWAISNVTEHHDLEETYFDEEKKLLQELVDKATPKKPIVETKYETFYGINSFYCPSCREQINIGEGCRNNECRQAIDWSNDES